MSPASALILGGSAVIVAGILVGNLAFVVMGGLMISIAIAALIGS